MTTSKFIWKYYQAAPLLCILTVFNLSQVWAYTPHPFLQELDYSSDIDYVHEFGPSFTHNAVVNDVLVATPPPLASDTPLSILNIRAAHVDGYYKDNNGLMYFSFNNDVVIGAKNILKSDIVRCDNIDCSSLTVVFDSDFYNLKQHNINAFTLDPNNSDIIFSLDSAAIIAGVSYLPADLIRYKPSTGIFSLEYDSFSSVFGLGAHKNIDAVVLLTNGHYLISLQNDGNYKGLFDYNNADILDYIPSTHQWSVTAITRSSLLKYATNLSALMGVVRNGIFADGFE